MRKNVIKSAPLRYRGADMSRASHDTNKTCVTNLSFSNHGALSRYRGADMSSDSHDTNKTFVTNGVLSTLMNNN